MLEGNFAVELPERCLEVGHHLCLPLHLFTASWKQGFPKNSTPDLKWDTFSPMKISLKVKNPKQPKNQSTNLVFCYFLLNLFLFTSTVMLQVHFGFILWNWSFSTQGTNWDTAKTWKIMSIVLFFFLKEKAVWGCSCGLGELAVVCATCQSLSPNLRSCFLCLEWQCQHPPCPLFFLRC